MKYSLSHIATCNSQYFRGHHLPVVQVLVDENTTYRCIKQMLLESTSTDHLYEDDRFGMPFCYDTFKSAVEELFANFTSLDYVPDSFYGMGSMEDDEEWDCYMYFVVETVEEDG